VVYINPRAIASRAECVPLRTIWYMQNMPSEQQAASAWSRRRADGPVVVNVKDENRDENSSNPPPTQ
jgi:hypothetical protein